MTMKDSLTILHSKGPRLTKLWRADGSIEGTDEAKHFSVEVVEVSNIRDLSAQLTRIEPMTSTCVIRGALVAGADPTHTVRTNAAFADVPRRWICFDIDHHQPSGDVQADPAAAVLEFIEQCLPAGFQSVSCHWQQSSSAGAPGKEGKLKMHLWFWLDQALDSWEARQWAKALALPVDLALLQQVQQHYTAEPVLEPGVVCPVRQRSGFIEGLLGDEARIEVPRQLFVPRAATGRKGMRDPREKEGVVGAFCRAYPPARVIDDDLVGGTFEWQDDSDVRITWIGSASGAPGGVYITEDCLHFGCSHGNDPFDNRAVNAWDFVRVHKFGALDEPIDPDAVPWLMSQGGMPSHRAMIDFARGLPDVAEQLEEEEVERQEEQRAEEEQERLARLAHLDTLRAGVLACQDVEALKSYVRDALVPDKVVDETDRNGALTVAVQARFAAFGSPQKRDDVRRMLRPPPSRAAGSGPEWMEDWVYNTSGDKFFNLKSKVSVTAKGFDALNSKHMPLASDGVHHESASDYAVNVWSVPAVDATVYAPGQDTTFEMLGRTWGNEFREDSVPLAGPGGEAAIGMVKRHLERLLPDERERGLLLSWMAYNARYPGRKVRWAPYLTGPQGTGKTFIAVVMGLVLGEANTKVLAGSSLQSNFNGWAVGAALVTIEEVYQAGHLFETEEKLKALVSNDLIDVHRKGKDNYSAPNFTNYLLLSNHLDGLPVDEGDRRYLFLRVAMTTEEAKALAAEGYFDSLFDTCRDQAGGLRRWLLEEVELHPEFDPNGRAPETEAKRTAVEMGRSDADLALEDLLRGRNALTTSAAALHLQNAGLEDVKTRTLNKLLTKRGFQFYKSMWLAGSTRRVYTRVGWAPDSDDAVRKEVSAIPIGFEGDSE